MAIPSKPLSQSLLLTFKLVLLRYLAANMAERGSPGKDYSWPSLPSNQAGSRARGGDSSLPKLAPDFGNRQNDPAAALALSDAARTLGPEAATRILRSVPGRSEERRGGTEGRS